MGQTKSTEQREIHRAKEMMDFGSTITASQEVAGSKLPSALSGHFLQASQALRSADQQTRWLVKGTYPEAPSISQLT